MWSAEAIACCTATAPGHFGSPPGGGDEGVDDRSQLGALVFLEEVAGTLDRGVRLTLGARHLGEEWCVTTFGDRIEIAEAQQERLLELGEHIPPSGRVDMRAAVIDVVDALAPLAAERE